MVFRMCKPALVLICFSAGGCSTASAADRPEKAWVTTAPGGTLQDAERDRILAFTYDLDLMSEEQGIEATLLLSLQVLDSNNHAIDFATLSPDVAHPVSEPAATVVTAPPRPVSPDRRSTPRGARHLVQKEFPGSSPASSPHRAGPIAFLLFRTGE